MKNYPLLLVGLLLFSTAAASFEKASPDQNRLKYVNAQQQVVPYSLDQILQTFTKTVHGGVQHVIAKSPTNTREIK